MTTPGISARSLYRCYHQIGLRPNKQNFLYETSLKRPAIAAMSDGPELKPIQKGEGSNSPLKNPPQDPAPSPPIKKELIDPPVQQGDSKLTIQDIMQKFKNPIYDSKVQKKRKSEKSNIPIVKSEPAVNKLIKSEPEPKRPKIQTGGKTVFKFY